jgi:hypothetical protein
VDESMSTNPGLDRRDFALAVGALAAGVALATTVGADEPNADAPTLPQTYENLVRLRFGKDLTAEQIKKVAQRVQGQRATSDAMKKIPLKNSDEPAVIFSADD